MKHYLFTILLLSFAYLSPGQNCSCEDKLKFVKTQIESNYAGHKDKVNTKTRKAYDAFSRDYLARARKVTKPPVCFALIHDWLKFFKDGHIQLAGNADNDADSLVLKERMKNTETIDLSAEQMDQIQHSNIPVEGVYTYSDSTYTIAIVQSKTEYRDFAGIIVSSKADTWKKGQVKLELKKTGNNTYSTIAYYRDHSYKVEDFTFDGTSFNDEWIKTGTSQPHKNTAANPEKIQVKKVNDNTLYVQIGSFDGSNARAIDSVFKTSLFVLRSTPNLILDLRGNGGGSDFSYRPIVQWLYTGPITRIGADVWCTPANTNGMRKMVLDNPDVPEDMKADVKKLVADMEQNTGRFIQSNADDTLTIDYVEPNPHKVVVLIDRYCASSAEQFLLVAGQSSKVTLMGETTAGVLDYANMRPSSTSPCKDIALYYATTRSRRIDMGLGIGNKGIKPNIELAKDKDWVEEAVKYLAQ